jgi:hypothetical protein
MRTLDRAIEDEVADAVTGEVMEGGYDITAEEAVPGLILAAKQLCEKTSDPVTAREEAAELLAEK